MQILFRVGRVTFLAGFNIYHPLDVLDSKAYHSLRMSFHNRDIHDKIATENIRIDGKLHSPAQIDFFKGPLKHVYAFDSVALLESAVAQSLEGMGSRFAV